MLIETVDVEDRDEPTEVVGYVTHDDGSVLPVVKLKKLS